MTKYNVEVWATVGSQTKREVIEIEQDHEPTSEELQSIHDALIANICDSGACIVDGGGDADNNS